MSKHSGSIFNHGNGIGGVDGSRGGDGPCHGYESEGPSKSYLKKLKIDEIKKEVEELENYLDNHDLLKMIENLKKEYERKQKDLKEKELMVHFLTMG